MKIDFYEQSSFAPDPRAVLLDTNTAHVNRVRTMKLFHDRVYRHADLSQIDLGTELRNLARTLIGAYGGQLGAIHVTVRTRQIRLPVDTAVPSMLVANELVTNALRHAFPNRLPGSIRIEVENVVDGSTKLLVRDDGIGLPESVDPESAAGVGLSFVHRLVKQMGGSLEIARGCGTAITVFFPPAFAAGMREAWADGRAGSHARRPTNA